MRLNNDSAGGKGGIKEKEGEFYQRQIRTQSDDDIGISRVVEVDDVLSDVECPIRLMMSGLLCCSTLTRFWGWVEPSSAPSTDEDSTR